MKESERRFTQRISTGIRQSIISHKQMQEKEAEEIEMIVKSHSSLKNQLLDIAEDTESSESSQDEKYSVQQSSDQSSTYYKTHKAITDNYMMASNPIQSEYDIRDLTYTMITSNLPILLTLSMFLVLVVIRYFTVGILIDIAITSQGQHILWLIVVIGDRIIYFILVVKISLKSAETRTQITLKSHWNSKESQINELFSSINFTKLRKSIIRGIIPAELAFLYITAAPRKKFEVYAAINYIYSSIQSVVYYPFFLIYLSYVGYDQRYDSLDQFFNGFTLGLSALAELIMLSLTIFLLLLGNKRKYGRVFWCCDRSKKPI